MMKKMMVIAMLLMAAACGKKDDSVSIGVSQIIEHPALDNTVDGFKRALSEEGLIDIDIEVQNAQGDFATAQTIGSRYAREKDLILAVSTPSAQAAYNATKDKPILITAVTDPASAGLVGDNISGTSDAAPVDRQMDLVKELLPEAENIGVVYNTSEQNSLVLLEQVKKEAEIRGMKVVERGITNVNEIALAMDSILGDIDVLYTPTDNLIVSSTPLVLTKAAERGVPVIGSIEEQVDQGALATATIDYEKLGYQTGIMAARIIRGEDISSMPVETLKDTKVVINEKSATTYGIEIGDSLRETATIIQ